MLIANPIYDVVFKYMMEDSKVAKLLIGSIIEREVLELDFKPKAFTAASDKRKAKSIEPIFTIYHLDFSARIQTNDGPQLVVIELQKAKLPTDILRFRRYLGQQYANKENKYWRVDAGGRSEKRALPIISIYFLGHSLESIQGIPVIQVNRRYIDAYSKTEITQRDHFIESLSHDSYVVSIEDLTSHRRNELEILLSIFDQSNRTQDHHILNVREEDFPEKYRPIIRRLQQAVEVPEIRNNMEAEDTYFEEFESLERKALEFERLAEERTKQLAEAQQRAEVEKQVAEEQKRLAEEQKRLAEEQKQAAEEQKRLAEEQKQAAEEQKRLAEEKELQLSSSARRMLVGGLDKPTVASFLGISVHELEKMTEK